MGEILGKAKTIRELLSGVKYSIDFYQREYKWGEKQVQELIDDLTGKFFEDYQDNHSREMVEKYGHYFLGSIIVSKKNNQSYIVDGQQRLTTITLLLIYLKNLKSGCEESHTNINELIFSEKFGKKSFNLNVEERTMCMEALYEGRTPLKNELSESVQNILDRYETIVNYFPEELKNAAMPHFVDWFIENVHMVEITAYSDEDAYYIFETMNDRGLSLSSIDMLKGYLLANIADESHRNAASTLWKTRLLELNKLGKDVAADFFKAWFRSQYATKIRERKKNAKPEDYDLIATAFHRWVRDNAEAIGLKKSSDYFDFINTNFNFYSKQYIKLIESSLSLQPGTENVFYNAGQGFTLQYVLLLAPLRPSDSDEEVRLKIRLVSYFIDILLTQRIWNFRSITYSTLQYAMFLVMRDTRGLDPKALAIKLVENLGKEKETTFSTNENFYLHQQNRIYIHNILARITDFVEQQSGLPSRYLEYTSAKGKVKYEIEHIWANRPELHSDEFPHPNDFEVYRSHIGGLLLLPKTFNASYGDLPFDEKLPHYNSQNLLARSLNEQCYERNPGFLHFREISGLPFKPYTSFNKADLDERQSLIRKIAEQIWNPQNLLIEAK